jgi:hypothetical protein
MLKAENGMKMTGGFVIITYEGERKCEAVKEFIK